MASSGLDTGTDEIHKAVQSFNINNKIVITGIVTTSVTTRTNWCVSGIDDMSLQSISSTPTSKIMSGGITVLQLSVPSIQLPAKVRYTFTLTATANGIGNIAFSTSSASLSVDVHPRPQGGYLSRSLLAVLQWIPPLCGPRTFGRMRI